MPRNAGAGCRRLFADSNDRDATRIMVNGIDPPERHTLRDEPVIYGCQLSFNEPRAGFGLEHLQRRAAVELTVL